MELLKSEAMSLQSRCDTTIGGGLCAFAVGIGTDWEFFVAEAFLARLGLDDVGADGDRSVLVWEMFISCGVCGMDISDRTAVVWRVNIIFGDWGWVWFVNSIVEII